MFNLIRIKDNPNRNKKKHLLDPEPSTSGFKLIAIKGRSDKKKWGFFRPAEIILFEIVDSVWIPQCSSWLLVIRGR